MAEIKITPDEMSTPELLAATMNKQYEKYNALFSTTATQSEVKALQAEIIVENKEILSKITASDEASKKLVKDFESLTDTIRMQGDTITKIKHHFEPVGQRKNLSDEITKKIVKEGALNDFIDQKTSSARFQIDTKDIAFEGTYGSGASGQPSMPFTIPHMPPMENFDVRLLLPTGTIDSAFLEYPKEYASGLTDATASKAENAALAESTMGFTMGTATVSKIGAFIEVSRSALKNSTWLASYVNNRLLAMLIKEINTEVIAGAASGTDLDGLINQANAFSAATNFSGAGSAEPTNFDVLRCAKSDMNSIYHLGANTVLINPTDAAIGAITKNTIEDYIDPRSFLTPNSMGYGNAWDMRLVESADITKGTFLMAAMQQAYMELLFNGPIEVIATDSHASNFIADLVTIKIQVNVMLPVYNANALSKATFATQTALIASGA